LVADNQSSSSRATGLIRKNSLKSTSRLKLTDLIEPIERKPRPRPETFWPLDLLPTSCPDARIYTWAYHTLAVDKKPLRLQNDIFAHAGELLLELANVRASLGARARPIIFVAHSTGGVLLKEVPHHAAALAVLMIC
jgi:hypothetical protein